MTHNFDKLFNFFEEFPQKLQERLIVSLSSKIFESRVRFAIGDTLNTLGLGSRTMALKRSFKILTPEITPNGLVYRIYSDNPQIERLDSGTIRDAKYTVGAKKMPDGTYAGVAPTGIKDKISNKVYGIIYDQIAATVNSILMD